MTGSIVLSIAQAAEPITARSMITLSRNPKAAATVACSRCGAVRSAHAIYRVTLGQRVCRTCLAHVIGPIVGQDLAPAKALPRIPWSNGLRIWPAGSARKLRQVYDAGADRNLPGAIVLAHLPVTPQDGPVPAGFRAPA